MNEAVMNIIIGVGCSLVASLLFVLFERLVKFGARQNINLIVNYIQDCYWQLEQARYFKDYPIAVAQADNIMQSIIQIYSEIRPLTFLQKKKKAVLITASVSPNRTILQSRIRVCKSNSSDRNVLVHLQGFEPWEQG